MWHLAAYKISVSLSFLNCIKNEMISYRIFELMLATLHNPEQPVQYSQNNSYTICIIELIFAQYSINNLKVHFRRISTI